MCVCVWFFRGHSLGVLILDVLFDFEIGPREGFRRRNRWLKHFFNGRHSQSTCFRRSATRTAKCEACV